MANKKRSEIRASARDILLDEFSEGVDLEFEDDYLNRIIRITLDEVENKMPYEVKQTTLDDSESTAIVTTADSKDIDISEITNLIRLRNWRPVEFEVGKNPTRWRNCFVFANTLTLDIDFLPSGDEAVYLYCLKKHTLTDATSTVGATAASVLLKGVCARAAQGKGRVLINSLNTGGVNVGPRMIEVGKMWMDEYKKALKTEALEDNYEVLPRGVS